MKKTISIILLLTALMLTFSACGTGTIKIEDHKWEMRTVMQTEGELFAVPAIGEANEAYPNAKIIDLTLTAQNGIITIKDATNNKTYSGTYKVTETTPDGTNYEIILEGQSGYATVAMTEYTDGSKEATLPINLGEYSIYFYAE